VSPVQALAAAIAQVGELWAAPRPGQVQDGVAAVCGGRVPASLLGIRLWPVLSQSGARPALLLADIHHRVHVVVDIVTTDRTLRPSWVAAATVDRGPRAPGSHYLWRHWNPELFAHAPHDWTSACDEHAHLARADAQGRLVAAVPQHDAWVMSRSWLAAELVMVSITDVHWVVLSPSAHPLRERDRRIQSQWQAVSFDDFAAVLATHHDADAALPYSDATLLQLMLPPAPSG
jgi:hypothetical protein